MSIRERLSICVCAFFPFTFEGGMWDLIELISDHCLSITLHLFIENQSNHTLLTESLLMAMVMKMFRVKIALDSTL